MPKKLYSKFFNKPTENNGLASSDFDRLAVEIIDYIISFLPNDDKVKLAYVCKSFNYILKEHRLAIKDINQKITFGELVQQFETQRINLMLQEKQLSFKYKSIWPIRSLLVGMLMCATLLGGSKALKYFNDAGYDDYFNEYLKYLMLALAWFLGASLGQLVVFPFMIPLGDKLHEMQRNLPQELEKIKEALQKNTEEFRDLFKQAHSR